MRRAVRILLVLVALGGLLFLFILPGRTWLQQRRAMSTTQHRLEVLNSENSSLAKQETELRNAAYVAQIARERYGLVRPGEGAYGILPPIATTTTTTTPATVPQRSR
jgi:cell division protein FtsB